MSRPTWHATLVFLISLSAVAHAEEWRKTFSLSGRPEISVDANDANLRVYAADRKDVEAVRHHRGLEDWAGRGSRQRPAERKQS